MAVGVADGRTASMPILGVGKGRVGASGVCAVHFYSWLLVCGYQSVGGWWCSVRSLSGLQPSTWWGRLEGCCVSLIDSCTLRNAIYGIAWYPVVDLMAAINSAIMLVLARVPGQPRCDSVAGPEANANLYCLVV